MSSKAVEVSFQRASNELEILRAKIYNQTGIWVFKVHTYSKEELSESEHFSKIYAITEKIGDDVQNWHNAGKFNYDYAQSSSIKTLLTRANFESVMVLAQR